jgi:hypothetical protein
MAVYQEDRDPYISIDNPSIHDTSRPGHPTHIDLTLDRIWLPKRSPDLHQAIEHRFGPLKQYLAQQCYKLGWPAIEEGGAKKLREIVVEYSHTITPEMVKADVARLKDLYKVGATPVGTTVEIKGKAVQGVGGGTPPPSGSAERHVCCSVSHLPCGVLRAVGNPASVL